MRHKPIQCEASVKIYDKKDCAFHAKLGWSKTEWHTHRKGQLIYAEHGIMRLYIHDKILYIPSMHAAWIPQGVEHMVATESVNIIFRSLYLDYSGLSKNRFYNEVSVFYADVLLREMLIYTERFNLVDRATPHEISFLEAIKQLLPQQAEMKIALQLPLTEHPQINQLIEYVQHNLDKKLIVPEIAKKFGFSERTLERLFQSELKMPITKYIKLTRMVKAVEMLVKPGNNVSEVAYAVGYDSLPTFSNNFNEVMGTRPNQFLVK